MSHKMYTTDILVIGAGPTGLTAACDAARFGLSVKIIERRQTRAQISKALVLHARTLEIFESIGCVRQMLEAGKQFKGLHVHTSAAHMAPTYVDLIERAWGDTMYPFWLSLPQYLTEDILEQHLLSHGESIDWGTELMDVEDHGDHIIATIKTPDGSLITHRARWILGCDGGRSVTREKAGITMKREHIGVTFALTDIHTHTDIACDEGHVAPADDGLLLIVPMAQPDIWRVIAQVPKGSEQLDAEGWNTLVRERSGIELNGHSLGWSSQFELSSGIVDHFRAGNIFLLGDAAHIHSPVGGQGLNTGVQDAHNLIWKLALIHRHDLVGHEQHMLLESYEVERRPIAQDMVAKTTRATHMLTVRNGLVKRAMRRTARCLLSSSRIKDNLARGVGMLDLLTDGAPRLPNPKLPDGTRLHHQIAPLVPSLVSWNGHTYLVRPDHITVQPGPLHELLTSLTSHHTHSR